MIHSPAFEELCAIADRHRLHVLLFTSDALISPTGQRDDEVRILESLAVVIPGGTEPIVGGYLGGRLDDTAARLIVPLRRALKETA